MTLLFGAMRDKRVGEMARALFPRAAQVVLTSVGGERAATGDELRRRTRAAGARARTSEGAREGLRLARRLTPPGGVVVVAGSLYLVGAILSAIGRAPGDGDL